LKKKRVSPKNWEIRAEFGIARKRGSLTRIHRFITVYAKRIYLPDSKHNRWQRHEGYD